MEKKLTIILLIGLLLGHHLPVQAQDGCSFTIRGKILDKESNEPVPDAFIFIPALKSGILSDRNGNFRIDQVCEGHYDMTVEFLGYKPYEQRLNVHGHVNLTIRLEQEEYLIDGVEIIGHRQSVNTTGTVSSLSQGQLDASRGENLGETLKRIAGVNTFSTGNNIVKPVIHGLHSNRIMILNNGVRQEGQQWGVEHAPEIDPFMAEEISVVKGAETVRFGPEAMGGAIVLNPPKLPVTKEMKGEAHLVGATNGRLGAGSLRLEGGSERFKGLGYRVQLSGKTGGNVRSPDYYQNNSGIRETNFSGALGYNAKKLGMELFYSRFETKIGILSDAHTGNLSDLEAIISRGRPFRDEGFTYQIVNPRQEVRHHLLKTKAHYHLNNGSVLNLNYAFQLNNRQEFDKRRGDLNDRPALDLELFTNTLELSYNHPTFKHWHGSAGISVLQQANNNIPGTGVTPLIPNYDLANFGIFAIEKFTSGHLEIEAGVRYDYRTVSAARYNSQEELEERDFTFNNFTAFLGGVYSFNNNLMISSNLGSAWRPPNINEQFSQGLHHGSAAVEIGNPDFESEQAYKWVNTLYYTQERWDVELTGYYNKIDNYIYLSPTDEQMVSLRGTFNVYEYQQTDAALWGVDLTTNYMVFPEINWYLRGSLIRAKDLQKNRYLPFIPTDRIDTGISFERDKFGKFTENKLTISHLTVFKQQREPEFDLAPAPRGYNLWKISMSTRLPIMGANGLKTQVSVHNVLDTSYKDYMNRFRYFTHEMGRNITLKLKYEF